MMVSTLKGFGVMVTDKGAKSYLIQYRMGGREAKTQRYTIGRHGSPWTAERARDRAAELLEQVRRKVDPSEAEQEALRSSREKAEAKAKADRELEVLGFSNLAATYIERDAKKNLRRWKEQEAVIDRDLKPAFGEKPLTSITADDINEHLEKVRERSSSAALKAYVALRAVYAYAHTKHRKLFPESASPFKDVERPEGGGQRERHLNDKELRVMWEASKAIGAPFGSIYQLLLLTGMRLREVAEGCWSEIDFEQAVWNVPAHRSKNGKAHWVHLSEPAIKIIKAQPKIGKCDFLFTTNGSTPVSGFSRAKKRLDTAMLKIMQNDAEDAGRDPADETLEPFVIHDTRRTFARGCQRLGQPPEVVERLLGHITDTESGLKGIYQTYAFENERIEATEKWSATVLNVVRSKPENIIVLQGAV